MHGCPNVTLVDACAKNRLVTGLQMKLAETKTQSVEHKVMVDGELHRG